MAFARRPIIVNSSSSAAGLARKAAKIGLGTYRYVRTIRKPEDTIVKFRNEFRNLDRELGVMEAATTTLGKDSRKALQESFDGLEKMMDQVIDTIPSVDPTASTQTTQSTQDKQKWPFTQQKTEEVLADMERYKTSINTILSAEGLVPSSSSASIARDLQSLVIVSQRLEASYEIKRNAESRLSGLRNSQGDLNRYFLPEETPAFFRATRGHLEHTVREEEQSILRQLADIRRTYPRLAEITNSLASNNSNTGSNSNHPGPYLSLLKTPAYKAWHDKSNTSTTSLFITGPRGEGKTALAHNLVQNLPATLKPNEILVSYFLRERERASPDLSGLLRALAVQMAYQSPEAKALAVEFVKRNTNGSGGSRGGRLTADVKGLQGLIADMAERFERVFVLANGIDEPPAGSKSNGGGNAGNGKGESLLPFLKLAHLSNKIQMVAFGRQSPNEIIPGGMKGFRDVDMSMLSRDGIHDIVGDKLKGLGVKNLSWGEVEGIVGMLDWRFGKQGLIGYRFAFELLHSFLLSSGVEPTAEQVKLKIREICETGNRRR